MILSEINVRCQKKHRRHGLSKKVQSASTMINLEEGFREPAFVRVTRLGIEQYLADREAVLQHRN